MHDGLDLVAVTGTSIYAAADGIVTGAGPNGRYGNWMPAAAGMPREGIG